MYSHSTLAARNRRLNLKRKNMDIKFTTTPESINFELPKGTVIDPKTTDLSKGKIGIKKERPYKYDDILSPFIDRRAKYRAYSKLTLLAEYYNKVYANGWEPDWDNHNQQKYYIVKSFTVKSFAFSCYHVESNCRFFAGNPIFATKELANQAFANNRELFEAYLS